MNEQTSMPGWVKILVGVFGIGVIWYLTPIFELLNYFVMIVCIPLALLASVGLIGAGTYNYIVVGIPSILTDFNNRVEAHKANMSAADAEPVKANGAQTIPPTRRHIVN